MSLGQRQRTFTLLVSDLICWAYNQGYEITFGDAWAHDGHKDNSFHYIRLAIDLNLFKNEVYLTQTEDHKPLGDYWKSLHPKCTWGGDFSNPDGNHYSFGE